MEETTTQLQVAEVPAPEAPTPAPCPRCGKDSEGASGFCADHRPAPLAGDEKYAALRCAKGCNGGRGIAAMLSPAGKPICPSCGIEGEAAA